MSERKTDISRDEALKLLRGGAAGVGEWNRRHARRAVGDSTPWSTVLELHDLDLRDAQLVGINLSGTKLVNVNLAGACLDRSDLSRAYLRHVTGGTGGKLLLMASGDPVDDAFLRRGLQGLCDIACDHPNVRASRGTTGAYHWFNFRRLMQGSLDAYLGVIFKISAHDWDEGLETVKEFCRLHQGMPALVSSVAPPSPAFHEQVRRAELWWVPLPVENDEQLSPFWAAIAQRRRRISMQESSFEHAFIEDADFSGANLAGTNFSKARMGGSNLVGSCLLGASLRDAYLRYSQFTSSVMRNADLTGARLGHADLARADLSAATLSRADCRFADLTQAELKGAHLAAVDLTNANLSGALNLETVDFTDARFGTTSLVDTCLSNPTLAWTIHDRPSTLSRSTLVRSRGKIPQAFLRGCGLSDWEIEAARLHDPALRAEPLNLALYEIHRLREGMPIMYYSLFISYSHEDEPFAQKLHGDLQTSGVRCWFAPHDMKAGEKIHHQVSTAIEKQDRVLLILSSDSMKSEWVATEIARARKKEREQDRRVLFPVRLVPFDVIERWESFDADSKKDSAREVREYFIPDFSRWQEPQVYNDVFQKLLKDLRAVDQTDRS